MILRDLRGLEPALRRLVEAERRRGRVRALRQAAEAAAGGPEVGDELALALRARDA